jgi:hypothetical protein
MINTPPQVTEDIVKEHNDCLEQYYTGSGNSNFGMKMNFIGKHMRQNR